MNHNADLGNAHNGNLEVDLIRRELPNHLVTYAKDKCRGYLFRSNENW